MISTIASAYEAAADSTQAEPHLAWRLAWQRLRDDWMGGSRPTPADLPGYLMDVPAADQQAALHELVAEHLRLSWESGLGRPLEHYSRQLSAAQAIVDAANWPPDLIADEFVARSTPRHGDQPALAEYAVRFPGRDNIQPLLARRCLANERYVKLRALGAGLLGVVHLAYDRVGGRQVALKEVRAPDQASESSRALFREAKLTAELNHPGIVPVFDVGYTADSAYYVMAYIAGENLAERIRAYHDGRTVRGSRENRDLFDELLQCVVQISTAVAHAHSRDILHRDLKPGNVILAGPSQPVIVDWGFALRIRSEGNGQGVPRPETVAGTPQYMAPEQVAGQESPASDVFSLGAVLHEVLTGRPPYDWPAGLPADWQASVSQAAIAPLAKKVPRDQASLAAICAKALSRVPAERFATPLDLATAVQTYREGRQSRGWWRSLLGVG